MHRRPPTMRSLILIRRRGWSERIASLPLFCVSSFLSFFCFLRLAYKSRWRMNRHCSTLGRRVLHQGCAFWGLEYLTFTFVPILTKNCQIKPEIGNFKPKCWNMIYKVFKNIRNRMSWTFNNIGNKKCCFLMQYDDVITNLRWRTDAILEIVFWQYLSAILAD